MITIKRFKVFASCRKLHFNTINTSVLITNNFNFIIKIEIIIITYINNNTIWPQRGSLNAQLQSNNNNDDDDELHHELSQFSEAPYVTPTSAGLMRDISCGSEIEDP